MKKHTLILKYKFKLITPILTIVIFSSFQTDERAKIANEVEHVISQEMLNRWYPLCIDKEFGGYLSTFTYDFKPTGSQDKMIVTQSRHTWSNSKAALFYPEMKHYLEGAAHGARFLRDVMWDKEFGGFYELVDRKGIPTIRKRCIRKNSIWECVCYLRFVCILSGEWRYKCIKCSKERFFLARKT
jgi:hypothetical protein